MSGREGLDLEASIRNATWMVRHYARASNSLQRARRDQAIQMLGLAVRDAFNKSQDFERLLTVLLDGLRPKDDPPF